MPASPAVFEQFCDKLGVDERYRKTLFWAGLLGLPAAWWAFGSTSQSKPAPDTHINAFFKQKPAVKPAAAASSKRQATSFHSFLKEVPHVQRDPSSFGAFLKGPGQVVSAAQPSAASPATSEAGPEDTDHAITVLFGTEYGFSKEVAERAAAAVKASGSYWYQSPSDCGQLHKQPSLHKTLLLHTSELLRQKRLWHANLIPHWSHMQGAHTGHGRAARGH